MKNDTEWSLGEHRQWLADANNKLEFFENLLSILTSIVEFNLLNHLLFQVDEWVKA